MKTNDKERKIGPKIQNTEMKTPNSRLLNTKRTILLLLLFI